jgi:prepilin-type N-terminal cleavage/methylation domain-containing protein
MKRKTRRRDQYGFTLIELLMVILILSIMMAVALPLYMGTVSRSERSACRANMQSIANADQAYRARNHPSYSYTTILTNLHSDLGATPLCPWTGTYTITVSDGSQRAENGLTVPSGGLLVQCSNPSHGVYAPSIDSE